MSRLEPTHGVRGSLFVREVEGVLSLLESGRLSRGELEGALAPDELRVVDDAHTAISQWYPISTIDKLIALMASKSGLTLPEFCRMRGARAAEALSDSGLYQQLKHVARIDASETTDPEMRVRALGRDLRLIVSLSKAMFNFTEWTVRPDPDFPRRLQIEISEASEFSDIQADCTDGFVNWAASRRDENRVWEWARPVPDVVRFRALRDA